MPLNQFEQFFIVKMSVGFEYNLQNHLALPGLRMTPHFVGIVAIDIHSFSYIYINLLFQIAIKMTVNYNIPI